MNFEGPAKQIVPKNPESDMRKSFESKFGKSLRCFKKWSRVGLAVISMFVAGEAARETRNSLEEYNTYADNSLGAEGLKQKEINNEKIEALFGEGAVLDINIGDHAAFFNRKLKDRKGPEFKGFNKSELPKVENYLVTEKFMVYPKGWVNGEVNQIVFSDSEPEKIGGRFKPATSQIFIYESGETKEESKNSTSFGVSEIFIMSHELGHANDWAHDTDLNIIERQELLLRVHERMIAPDSFHDDNGFYDDEHKLFMDGTQTGLYKATSEYWAEICAQYFSNPQSFLKKFPKDFVLVDEYAKKNDPSFDIFSPDRGAFDSHTGKLRDVWQGK